MSFFILTGAILIGTVFIVHYAANALGFRLFYTSLFLSAVFAFSINLIVISMRDVTSPLSIAKIFLAVLFASALVTIINEVFVRREKKKLEEKRKKKQEIARERAKEKAFEAALDEAEETDEDDNIKEVKEEVQEKESLFKRLFNKLFAVRKKKETENTEEVVNVAEEQKETTAESSEVLKEDEPKTEEVKEVKEPKKENFISKLFKKGEKPKREKLDMSQFADLDAVLDFAYEAKISGRYEDAVDAYEGAIENYEDDPYLPFLFIDLANVHKAQGEYDAAIDIYQKAINMPNIEKDSNILKSFNENIDYLKALKTVLRKHKIEHKPFGEIDESILKEVEERVEN